MSEFSIEPKVIVPKNVTVRLVYAEDLYISNIFRVIFDVCLALEMTFVGAALSATAPPTTDRRVLLWVLGILAAIFLGLNLLFMFRARRDS